MRSMLFALVLSSAAALGAEEEVAGPLHAALVEAVHHFAEEGKLDHVQALLKEYSGLLHARRDHQLGKPTHGDGYTPLQTAAAHGADEVVALLIKLGADVSAADGYGYTSLHLAAEKGNLNTVKQLVRAGAKLGAKTKALPGGIAPGAAPGEPAAKLAPVPARTALEIATDQGHAEVAAFLKTAK
jgi:hypothetical protein